MLENVREGSGDDAAVRVPLSASSDRECFARAGLAVCKDSAVVAFEAVVNDVPSDSVEDGLLLREHVEDAIVLELVVVLLDLVVAKAFLLEVKFHLAIIRTQPQSREWLLGRPNPQVDFNA